VSHTKGITQIESVLDQGADEIIWIEGGRSGGRLEKTI
jgi:hypothetical protein